MIPARAQTLLVDMALHVASTEMPDGRWAEAVERLCQAAVVYADSLKRERYAALLRKHGVRLCPVQNCTEVVRAGGLCEAHYRRRRKGMPLDPNVRRRPDKKRAAVVVDLTDNQREAA
jgi:hypothetical protein